MKTKQGIIILGIVLILLLCLSIPVAESFALNTGSQMDFMSKITSAFTDPPKGSVLHRFAAFVRSSDDQVAQVRVAVDRTGSLTDPGGIAHDALFRTLSETGNTVQITLHHRSNRVYSLLLRIHD